MMGIMRAAIIPLVVVMALPAPVVAGDIYVDGNAAPGGDGTSPAAAYRTILAAVTDANGRADGATIRVAEGTYVESLNTTITRAGVRILGSTVLAVDARGLPTGDVTSAARVKMA